MVYKIFIKKIEYFILLNITLLNSLFILCNKMNSQTFESLIETVCKLLKCVSSRVENPVITGSVALVIHQRIITGNLPTIVPGDFDFVTIDGKRIPPELPHIGDFRRVQTAQCRSCTYIYNIGDNVTSFDLNFGENVKFVNVTLFGKTLCVQQLDQLLKRYVENHTEIDEESDIESIISHNKNQAKIDILRELCVMQPSQPAESLPKCKRGLFCDDDDEN